MEDYSNSTENSAFYRKMFFPSASILVVVAIIGIYGHFSLIWATTKFKYLQNPCNILIAILAIGDLGHQIGQFPYAFMIFSGITFVTQRSCYWIQLLPAFLMQHSIINTICLGMDRFYCITCPIGYRAICSTRKRQVLYLLAVNIPSVVFSLALVILAYVAMEKDPEKETLCLIAAFFTGDSADIWAALTMLFTGCAVMVYILIWIIVWKKSHGVSSIKNTLKPLTIILCLTFFGWFTGMGMVTVISNQSEWPVNLRVGYISYAGISINVCIAANYFVYKYFGSDYKKAFKNLWRPKHEITATNPSNTGNVSSQQRNTNC